MTKFASHHLLYVVYMCQKSLNFTYAFKCYQQNVSGFTLAGPPCICVDIFSFFLLQLLYCRAVPARRTPGTKHLTLMLMSLAFIIQITSELFQSIAVLQCSDTDGQHEGHSVCKNVFQQAPRFSWRRPDPKWRKSQEKGWLNNNRK